MKCEKCGRQIGIEDLKCPHCGADNPFAGMHDQNMKQYKKRYGKTAGEVLDSAKDTGRLGKKAAVIVVLILAIIVMMAVASYNYADHDNSEALKKEANKNPGENIEIIDALLEDGDYMECRSFIYSKSIMSYDADEYDALHGFAYVLDSYGECIEEFEELICCLGGEDHGGYFDSYNTYFCRDLDSFYEVYETWVDSDRCAKYRDYMVDMEYELKVAVMVYLGMNEEEFNDFMTLSEAQKSVKIEEVLDHEAQ